MVSDLEKRLLIFISLNDLPNEYTNENKLLRYIIDGDFSAIIKTFLEHLFHRTYEVENNADSFTSFLRCIIHSFIKTCNSSYSQIDILCVGIGFLYEFVQCNWTGPSSMLSDNYIFNEMEKYCKENGYLMSGNLQTNIRDSFTYEDEEIISNMHRWELLFIAKCIFENVDTTSSPWWLLRTLAIHQRSIIHPSSYGQDKILELINKLEIILEEASDKTLNILFWLEATEIYTGLYSNYTRAQDSLQKVLGKLGLDIYFSGVLGKRTRFQVRDLPQLVLRTKLKGDTEQWTDNDLFMYEGKSLPKDIKLNDEVRLPSIQLADTEEVIDNIELNILHQAAILALYAVHVTTMPKDDLSIEELLPKLTYLLNEEKVWSLHMATLQFRSLLEANHSRTVERALAQLGCLLDATESTEPPVVERLLLFHCSHMLPKWKVEAKSGEILLKLGCVKSALDIFLKLQTWELLVECYNTLNMKHKAAEVLRAELEKKGDNVRIWCLLGDATNDESCYEKAWQLSGNRSWLALKHWGLYYFNKKEYAKSISILDSSLKINSLQVQLWFNLGYANLVVEDWNLCAIAYRHYCYLEPENFEAWNNLSKAYVNLGEKERALKTLKEAVKYSYDNWKVWENMLVVSAICKDADEVVRCYDRLLDLKGKYIDLEMLKILVNHVTGCKNEESAKNVLTLFGKLTSRVTDNADIWCLYAILTRDCNEATEKRDHILNYLQKAHNIYKRELAEKHSIDDYKKFMDITLLLIRAYGDYIVQAEPEIGKELLSTSKMMLRGVISTIKKKFPDVEDEEFQQTLRNLEQIMNNIQMGGITLDVEQFQIK